MATDGVKIIDGDLAFDIYNIFMEMYDAGYSLLEIKQAVAQFSAEDDGFDYEIYITVYALALWQTGQLTSVVLTELDKIIARGACVKVWTEECGIEEGRKRQSELDKLKNKISQPNINIRKRKIHKEITKFIFEEDAVLVFQLPDKKYCATILMEVFQSQGRHTYRFITSIYLGDYKPTIETIASGGVLGRNMSAGFDFPIGLDVTTISPKNLRSFVTSFEQVGKLEIRTELKKVGSYGGAIDFDSFCWVWKNRLIHTKNIRSDKILLKELL